MTGSFWHGHQVIKLVLLTLFLGCHWFSAHTQVHYDSAELTVAQGAIHTLLVGNLEWTWEKTSATVENGVIRVQDPQIDASGNGTVEVGLLAKKFYDLSYENAPRTVYAVKAEINGTDVTYVSVDNYDIVLTVDEIDTDPIKSMDMGQVFWEVNVADINNVQSTKANGRSRMVGGGAATSIEMIRTPHGFGSENIGEEAPSGAESQVTDVTDLSVNESCSLLSSGLRRRPTGTSGVEETIPPNDTWSDSGENDPLMLRGTGPEGGSVPSGPSTSLPMLCVVPAGTGVVAVIALGTSSHIKYHYSNSGESGHHNHHHGGSNNGNNNDSDGNSNDNDENSDNNDVAEPKPQDLLAYVKVTGDVILTSVKIPGIEYPIVFQPLLSTY